jgi:HD-like signal output (HDOD) protein
MNASIQSSNENLCGVPLAGQQEQFVENRMDTAQDDGATSVDLDALFTGVPLPAMPQSAVRLLEVSEDPQNGPAAFAEVLENDPALASQVLRFVNSSYFGFRNEISSVKQGITLVGIRSIKTFVLWTAVFRAAPDPKCSDFAMESFRHDALRRGLFAKSLGQLLNVENLDEIFTAALLQDIAVPFLVKEFRKPYAALLGQRKDGSIRLSQLEHEEFGWTHSDAACTLFERWNFPDSISDLVQSHTDVDTLIVQPDCKAETLAVALSSMLPADCDDEWHECERLEESYRRIAIDRAPTLQELLVEVDQAFVGIATSLGVGADVLTLAKRYSEAPREATAS